jgi:hypothetical protein
MVSLQATKGTTHLPCLLSADILGLILQHTSMTHGVTRL